MGSPFGKICSKTEDAFGSLIESMQGVKTNGVQVVKGFQGTTTLTVPRIEVRCPKASAEPETYGDTFTGNWVCDVVIVMVTNYKDTTRDDRENLSGELFDMILQSNVEGKLNNQSVPDFHAYGGEEGEGEGFMPMAIMRDPAEHNFVEMLTGTLRCRPQS